LADGEKRGGHVVIRADIDFFNLNACRLLASIRRASSVHGGGAPSTLIFAKVLPDSRNIRQICLGRPITRIFLRSNRIGKKSPILGWLWIGAKAGSKGAVRSFVAAKYLETIGVCDGKSHDHSIRAEDNHRASPHL